MRNFLFAILIILLWTSSHVSAQLVTSGAQGPQALVQNVLVGTGVTVSNINYTGAPQAIGYFNSQNANVGLTEGIIMTTGTIHNNGNGPHGPNNQSNAGYDNGRPGYGLLTNLAGNTTFNAAVLEFDFVPYADYVEFRYVFGSEEYPEYVCTPFNDVFGFFISGPGIAGGLQNIAKIPGTNSPVAINTVNSGSVGSVQSVSPQHCSSQDPNWQSNSIYYRANGDGNQAPYNGSTQYVQYDGLTRVLTASSNVICGERYHIIIAIADVGDGVWDSGIFLEANSFSSPVFVDVSFKLSSLSFDNDYTMAEGCTDATITLTRYGEDLSDPLTVPIWVSGTATEGVDYTNVPSSITFAPNQSQVSFTITAFEDGIIEGLETIILEFGIPDPCGGSENYMIELAINDLIPVDVELEDNQVDCPGDPVFLTAEPSGGGLGYTYLWSTGETTQTIEVSPLVTTSYTVTVTDNCLNESASASSEVFVPTFDPITLNTTDDIVDPCPYVGYTFTVEATGGAGAYAYTWFDNFGVNYGVSNVQDVQPGTTTTYYVLVEDYCGETALDSVTVTITSPPLVPYVLGDTTICLGDSALLTAWATGGYGDYYFYWPHSGDTTSQVWVSPRQTGQIHVIVSDDCQTFTVQTFGSVEVLQPIANFSISSGTLFEDLPIQFENTTYGGNTYFWEFGDGQTSTAVHPSNVYDEPGAYFITLYAENDIGCRDSITKSIRILPEFYIYVPNTITPNNDGSNDYFSASTINVVKLEVRIFNRWGEELFYSDDKRFQWDGTYNGQPVPDGVYVYKISYLSINGDDELIYGHVNVLR